MDFYTEDFLMNKAENLANKIVKAYKKYHVFISIKRKNILIRNDRFIYKINLQQGTRIADLHKYAAEMKMKLKLQLFFIEEKELALLLIVSEDKTNYNHLKYIQQTPEYEQAIQQMELAHPIGIDSIGRPVIEDLALYPHMIISGTTTSGKSVSLKILLMSMMYQYSPAKVNFVICDMANDFSEFLAIPHLSCPVIETFDQFFPAMLELKKEMERRVQLKNSKTFPQLPHIICVVDEFTSFISGTDAESKMVREVITELLRRGRHTKIHMVLAAHNPTQRCLKGLDISDLPTKMVFRVARQSNSITILNERGAEKLRGNGDMLFQSTQSGDIQRIQGAFVPPEQIPSFIQTIKKKWMKNLFLWTHKFRMTENTLQQTPFHAEDDSFEKVTTTKGSLENTLLAKIIMWSLTHRSISCNMMMETFHLGWQRANRYMKKLKDIGIIGELDAKLPRVVLPDCTDKLSLEIQALLKQNGFSIETVSNAFHNRKEHI